MKDWRSVILVAMVALLLGRESAHTQSTGTVATPVDPTNPISIRITDPIPVILVAPVGPRPPTPTPYPPVPPTDPTAPDTTLARAGREYLRAAPAGLQALWNDMADKIERGEIADKAAAVQAHNHLSAPLNTALDQMFATGMDARGKIINRGAIVAPLRQSAAALGRSD